MAITWTLSDNCTSGEYSLPCITKLSLWLFLSVWWREQQTKMHTQCVYYTAVCHVLVFQPEVIRPRFRLVWECTNKHTHVLKPLLSAVVFFIPAGWWTKTLAALICCEQIFFFIPLSVQWRAEKGVGPCEDCQSDRMLNMDLCIMKGCGVMQFRDSGSVFMTASCCKLINSSK